MNLGGQGSVFFIKKIEMNEFQDKKDDPFAFAAGKTRKMSV